MPNFYDDTVGNGRFLPHFCHFFPNNYTWQMAPAPPKINKTAVRQLLKLWDAPHQLGQHPLAERLTASHSTSPTDIGRGLALKTRLNDAIQTLRPDDGEPQPHNRAWRPFLIITRRYCLGRLPDWIMVELSVSSRTFYRELNQGIRQIGAHLQHVLAELPEAVEGATASTSPGIVPPPEPILPPPPPPTATAPLLTFITDLCEHNSHNYSLLDAEEPIILAALEQAKAQKYVAQRARLLFAVIRHWLDRGRVEQAEQQVRHALSQVGEDLAAQARLTICLGRIAEWHSDHETAQQQFRQGIIWATQLGLPEVALNGQVASLRNFLRQGKPEQTYQIADAIGSQIEQHSDPHWRAAAYLSLSAVNYYHARYDVAFQQVQHARQLYETLDEPARLMSVYQNLGVIAVERGQYAEAFSYYELGLAQARATENRVREAQLLNNLGVVALNTGQWRKAQTLHAQALALRRELGDEDGISQSLINLGVLYLAQRNSAEAHAALTEGLALARQREQRPQESKFLVNLAWQQRQVGAFAEALKTAESSLIIAQAIDRQQGIAEALEQAGLASLALGDAVAAEEALQAAHNIWAAQQLPHRQMEVTAFLAQSALVQGNAALAHQRLAPVLAHLAHSLDGLEDTAVTLLICADVLAAAGETAEADAMRAKARTYLHQQSLEIEDTAVRQAYLASYNL
ncbi:MAG: tetratricopeptide repeat protein [Ardenticatenaceae bacterium]|nr:tetratricopeptide repeat protein [Ardenticatenaceae bacterium]